MATPHNDSVPLDKPVTLRTLQKRAEGGGRFAMLTCYDATTARHLAAGGVEALLVGDTAAEMILGYESTIHAPLDFMVEITAAVKRGAPSRFVMADMPFMSYQPSIEMATINAGRFLTEARADAVKLEVNGHDLSLVERLANAGVPVVAHIGSRPQQVKKTAGYRAAGKSQAESDELLRLAKAFEAAGAVMLLLEATTAECSQAIVEQASVPVIGCGAGPACHGHVVVLQDLLNLTSWQPPFAQPLADLATPLRDAAAKWAELARSGEYLADNHPYKMKND